MKTTNAYARHTSQISLDIHRYFYYRPFLISLRHIHDFLYLHNTERLLISNRKIFRKRKERDAYLVFITDNIEIFINDYMINTVFREIEKRKSTTTIRRSIGYTRTEYYTYM